MSQTSYSTYQGLPFPGVLADNSDKATRSFINAETSANFPFGIALAKGAGDQDAILMVNASSTIAGVGMHTHQVDPYNVAGSPAGAGVPPKSPLSVLTRGRIYVQVEESVTPTSPVFVRHTAGAGGTQPGAFRASVDSASAVAWTAARYLTSAVAGGMAQLEVNLP